MRARLCSPSNLPISLSCIFYGPNPYRDVYLYKNTDSVRLKCRTVVKLYPVNICQGRFTLKSFSVFVPYSLALYPLLLEQRPVP